MDELSCIIQEHNIRLFTANEGEVVTTEEVISSLIGDGVIDEHPTFIIDLGTVARTYDAWVEYLPKVECFYAVKCCSDPVVMAVLAAKGARFDVASYNEISLALERTGAENLLLAHPIKTTKTISYARAVDCDLMTFDSSQELLKIKLYHPEAKLLMRLKVDDTGSLCRFSCKFGVDHSEVPNLLALAQTLDLNVCGFSFHVGSGCTSPDLYVTAISQCFDAFGMAKDHGMNPSVIDLGGGFVSETFADFAAVIRPIVDKYPELRWIAEPGRLFASQAATLVVTVVGKKETGQGKDREFVYYLNDSIYGSFNNLFFDHQKVVLLPFNERSGQTYKSRVFGCTCDSIDVISQDCKLPNLAIGEKLYALNMGAYSMSTSSSFNGFERARPVYVLTA
jgi:ornithine decarboxylase